MGPSDLLLMPEERGTDPGCRKPDEDLAVEWRTDLLVPYLAIDRDFICGVLYAWCFMPGFSMLFGTAICLRSTGKTGMAPGRDFEEPTGEGSLTLLCA